MLLVFVRAGNEPYAYQEGKTYKLVILHTNDHHGRFWKNQNNEYGLAARKTLIDSVAGGDGYPDVTAHPSFVDTGYTDADLLREYIAKNSPMQIKAYAPTHDVVQE